jgi:hypothetical protein
MRASQARTYYSYAYDEDGIGEEIVTCQTALFDSCYGGDLQDLGRHVGGLKEVEGVEDALLGTYYSRAGCEAPTHRLTHSTLAPSEPRQP